MRHLKKGRKFGREKNQRRALLKSLASSFFMLGKIKTTEAKAKEARSSIERILTRAKTPTLANRRLLLRFFPPHTVQKIFEHASAIRDRTGGYTRIIKLGARKSDGAKMVLFELVR